MMKKKPRRARIKKQPVLLSTGQMRDRLELERVKSERDQAIDKLRKRQLVVDVFAEDPIPSGETNKTERERYVAEVAMLHERFLEPKLRHVLARTMHLLADDSVPDDQVPTLRGTCYALTEMMLWGKNCVAEDQANREDKKSI